MTAHVVKTPRQDAIWAVEPRMYRAQRRVEWRHVQAMLDSGVPMREMVRGGCFTFGVCTVAGREMIVTEDHRLRAYLTGPVIASLPENILSAREQN